MVRKFLGLAVSLSAVLVLCFSSISYATGIRFSSSAISSRAPCQNSSITYSAKIVNTYGSPVSGAKVTLKVYYKSKTTSYSAGSTNSQGKASKKFKIGLATARYKVVIKSTATKSGQVAHSSSWFKPKKCG